MQTTDNYTADHLIAKAAIYVSYITIGITSIESGNPYMGLILGTGLWLFGVNTVAYAVETVRGHEHRHNMI